MVELALLGIQRDGRTKTYLAVKGMRGIACGRQRRVVELGVIVILLPVNTVQIMAGRVL